MMGRVKCKKGQLRRCLVFCLEPALWHVSMRVHRWQGAVATGPCRATINSAVWTPGYGEPSKGNRRICHCIC